MPNDPYNNRKGVVQGPLCSRVLIEPRSKIDILAENQTPENWAPSLGTIDSDERYLGSITRYKTEYNSELYTLTIRRTLKGDAYTGIITKGNSAIGSLNHRGFSQSLDSKLLNIIVDLATPSARKVDKELANLADLAKNIITKKSKRHSTNDTYL